VLVAELSWNFYKKPMTCSGKLGYSL